MTPLLTRDQSAERAFERLYRAHVRDIYRYALMVTRNPEDAEDVVQTTFLKAFRAFEAGERARNPRHWLVKIAHNTCRSRMRDAKRRPQEVALEEQLRAGTQSEESDGVRPGELLRALGELTFNQRAALVMRELEGRSYAEIAQVLELSPSAVETVLFRARRALREQLEGTLACGGAERALSLDLDGRLDKAGRAQLRAHLRSCRECAGLARRQRARRAALGALGPVQLPASLASWGGGAAAGAGIAAKVAVVVVAGAAAAGVSFEAAEAVSEPGTPDRAAIATAAPARPAAAFLEQEAKRAAKRVRPSVPAAAAPVVQTAAVAGVVAPASSAAARSESAATSTVSTVASVVQLPEVSPPPELPVALPPAPAVPMPSIPSVPEPALPVEPPEVPEVVPALP